MGLETVSYTSVPKDTWDAFCHASDEAWLWHLYDFQDVLGTWSYYEPISVAIVDKASGEIMAVIPLHLVKGVRIDSLGAYATANSLTPRQKKALLSFIAKYLKELAHTHAISEISLWLAPMAPAYTGGCCPRVNPLLWLGCENTLTQTWVVDLQDGKDAVWNRMEGRARTAIRKAEKNGVTVRHAEPNDLAAYYDIHCATYSRTGIPPHPKEYFNAIWARFFSTGMALILVAEHKGKPVAMENFGVFKEHGIYWTGASSSIGLDLEANSLIQWHAIMWMIERGFSFYETGEAFPCAKSGKEKGLNDFKRSFGGVLYPIYRGRLHFPDQKSFPNLAKEPLITSLRRLKRVLLPILGPRITEEMGKIFYIADVLINNPRRVKRLFIPKIGFIKPFWSVDELNLGSEKAEIDTGTSVSRLTESMTRALHLNDRCVIATSSGRTAIELALRILKADRPERRKVILQSYGCRGTFDPIIRNGLTPVFVEITQELLADTSHMTRFFDSDTLACLIVNLTGKRADVDILVREARKKGIATIEDNCQRTFPSPEQDDENEADILAYSFGLGKNLIATGGGALASRILKKELLEEGLRLGTPDPEDFYKRFAYIKNTYFSRTILFRKPMPINTFTNLYKYDSIDPLDGEIVIRQFAKLDEIIRLRRDNAAKIIEAASLYPDVFSLQSSDSHIYTKFSIRLRNKEMFHAFIEHMTDNNIELENMYIPLHQRDLDCAMPEVFLPVTERLAPLVINLPVRPNLTEREIRRVLRAIKSFGESYTKNGH